MEQNMSPQYKLYLDNLEASLDSLYIIARQARKKGLDPSFKPECIVARDLAELVEGLVGPKGVANRIRELSIDFSMEVLVFKIVKEIIDGNFGQMEKEKAAEQSVRTGLAILTEGLTAAPIQGVSNVKIKRNNDGSSYLAIYFAGPIRSAGGTDQALTLVIGDFIRTLLSINRYLPTEQEISRFIEEVRIYERSVGRFQYHVSDEELKKALQQLPVEVTGTETNSIEVSSYRNLSRVETNCLRGGALRVVNDGVIGRAAKVWTVIEKLNISGWDWLKGITQISKKKSAGFMDDVIAGRPIFSFPSRKGGFRLRYGRARNTGLSSVGVHPATMAILDDFLVTGTQLRLELPGKGGISVPVDTIEPPIVKLRDGSVVKVAMTDLPKIKKNISNILFLGDLLVSYGDFLYNSKILPPSGYVEEWWIKDVYTAITDIFKDDLEKTVQTINIPLAKFNQFLTDPYHFSPNGFESIHISLLLNVPLHPSVTYFWSFLPSVKNLRLFRNWLETSLIIHEGELIVKIVGIYNQQVKLDLERICIPHRVVADKIIIEGDSAHVFAFCLGLNKPPSTFSTETEILDALYQLSNIRVMPKAPTFVGARMGRPEKAKRREMSPLVHVLFPIGLAGGSRRNIVEAAKKNSESVEIVNRKCPVCQISSFNLICLECGSSTLLRSICPRCGKEMITDLCPICQLSPNHYEKKQINLKNLLDQSRLKLGFPIPKLIKGVKRLSNKTKTPELLEKGVLRVKHDLSVYKDGTIRFDATNAPLTHFSPEEINVSLASLKKLGYTHDFNGDPLIKSTQICELKIQDIIIPLSCAKYFRNVSHFVDDLLQRVYSLSPYYNLKYQKELVGHLVLGLAPHTSVGILGRIIGFTNMNVCYAHPVWHSAKRRDCDGDEDALMLALETLLDFSREYLPEHIGGIMDAPLLLLPIVNPQEVQRQAHAVDVACDYSVEFYKKTWENVEAKQCQNLIDVIGDRLGTNKQFEGYYYTTPTTSINLGSPDNSYKKIKTMIDKLLGQLKLAEKIDAVDEKEVALKVLTTHFIRDMVGNLRAFLTQKFRCKSCNKRFRRLPLRGTCSFCNGPLTLTVYRGGIEKYFEAAQNLVKKYSLPLYYKQRINFMKEEIALLFDSSGSKQIDLTNFL